MISNQKNNLKAFCILSIGLHCVILWFLIFYTPNAKNIESEQETIVVLSMAPIQEKTNIKTQKKLTEKPTEDVLDAKKSEQSLKRQEPLPEPIKEEPKPEPIKEEPKPEPIKEEPKPEPIKEEPKPEPIKEEPKPEPIKEEPKPEPIMEEPKPEPIKEEPKPEPIKEEPKPAKKKDDVKPKPATKDAKKKAASNNELDALLKNLEASSDGDNAKSKNYKRLKQPDVFEEALGNEDYDDNAALSISEIDAIKKALNEKWLPPMGATLNPNLKIILNINFKIDGSVEDVNLISPKNCGGTVPIDLCQSFIDSAKRAVISASPFDGLTPERFKNWQNIKFSFTPIGIF